MTSPYDLTISTFVRALEQQLAYLRKAEEWAAESKMDHAQLMDAKLTSDMLPLSFQLQTSCKIPNDVLARLNGKEEPAVSQDGAESFQKAYDRLEATINALKTSDRSKFISANDTFTMKMGRNVEVSFSPFKYLQNYAVPNFFFHHVTAYDILRSVGAPLGKKNYLFGHGTIVD